MKPFGSSVLLLALLPGCGLALDSLPNIDTAEGETIVVLGDSLTRGPRVGRDQLYTALLDRDLPFQVKNAGISGDTTAKALDRLERDVLAHDPTIVVVLLGGNDGLRRMSRQKAAANLTEIVDRVIAAGAVPVLIGFDMGIFTSGFTGFIEEVADATGALYLDDILDDVLRDPSLKTDSIHPNADGHRVIAERLRPHLLELIEVLEAARRA